MLTEHLHLVDKKLIWTLLFSLQTFVLKMMYILLLVVIEKKQ